MASSELAKLSEDHIDDLLYFARTGEQSDLQETVEELSKALKVAPAAVLAAAVDENSRNTILHMAAANGHDEIMSYVLKSLPSSPVTAKTSSSSNAAAESSPPPPAQTSDSSETPTPTSPSPSSLLTFLNATNSSLSTPLHWAALNGHIATARILVDAGADVTLENASKHDALDEAERAQRPEVVRFLMARLSGKTEEEVRKLEEEREREEKEGAKDAGEDGVKATQEDLEKLGLEAEEGGADAEGGVQLKS